ncbi:MAG: hypothetical protein RLZZ292_1779 [Bacteroidota bacterium]|jgi:tetratricopeptide (TPR) repeat protein
MGNMNLGHVYLAQQKEDKAMACYLQSLEAMEDTETFWQCMNDDFQYLEQYDITRAYYDAVLERVRIQHEKR